MSNMVQGNPIEALISQFRTVTNDLEVLAGDSELAGKVKGSKKIQKLVGELGDALETNQVEVSESFGKEMAKIYEAMVLSQDSDVGDEQLKRKVEAAAELAEDYGIDRVVIDQLVERYNAAKDTFLTTVGGKSTSTGGKDGRYGNSYDDYRSDSVRGVRRHLTVVYGKDWKEKLDVKVIDTNDDSEVD